MLILDAAPADDSHAVAGWLSVLAVDFSRASLKIMQKTCSPWAENAASLRRTNSVGFAKRSVGGLMMADFLQHLGPPDIQRAFLHKAFSALKPNGWFFQFFNANVVNRLKKALRDHFRATSVPKAHCR